jgi:hypothetical protein
MTQYNQIIMSKPLSEVIEIAKNIFRTCLDLDTLSFAKDWYIQALENYYEYEKTKDPVRKQCLYYAVQVNVAKIRQWHIEKCRYCKWGLRRK